MGESDVADNVCNQEFKIVKYYNKVEDVSTIKII